MRTCPACSFENMNSCQTCAQCGAKLIWDGPTDRDSFQPPRAGWNKVFYPVAYFLATKLPLAYNIVTGLQRLPSRRVTACALSIVPGLGHWYLGERGEALRPAFIWGAVFLLAVFLYYSAPRALLLVAPLLWAILMSIHCFIVVSAARPGLYCKSASERRTVWIILLILVLVLYLTVGHIIQSFLVIWLEYRI